MKKIVNRLCMMLVTLIASAHVTHGGVVFLEGSHQVDTKETDENGIQRDSHFDDLTPAYSPFPTFGSSSTFTGGAKATVSYSYTDSAGVPTLHWSTAESLSPAPTSPTGDWFAFASTYMYQRFTMTTSGSYDFNTTWQDNHSPDYAYSETRLKDEESGSYVFRTIQERGGTDSPLITILGDVFGNLGSGRVYIFENYQQILNYSPFTTRYSAANTFAHTSGDFNFTVTSAVPEPTSMAMWILGALGMVVAGRKRMQQAFVLKVIQHGKHHDS